MKGVHHGFGFHKSKRCGIANGRVNVAMLAKLAEVLNLTCGIEFHVD
jgi:hypothetical protein